MIRIVHNTAATFLFASFGFMVASAVAYNTSFRPWSDGLAAAAGWNAALGVAFYALQVALHVAHGVVRLIAYLRRTRPFLAMDMLDHARTSLLLVLAVLLIVGPYLGAVWYLLGWPAVVTRLQWAALPCLVLLAWVAYQRVVAAAGNRRRSRTTSEDGRS